MIAVCLAWATVALYVVHAAIPRPVVDLPFQDRRAVTSLFPEGWAFFTRDAKEMTTSLYRWEEGSWRPAGVGANGDPEHAFGLRRFPRVQLGELNALTAKVPKEVWSKCDTGGWMSCLQAQKVATEVQSPAARPTLCGRVGLVRHAPVPWNWFGSVDPERMPSEAIVFEVRC